MQKAETLPGKIMSFLRNPETQEAILSGGMSLLRGERNVSQHLLDGIGLFEDLDTRRIYREVQYHAPVTDLEVLEKLRKIDEANKTHVVYEDVQTRLGKLVDSGFVKRIDGEEGSLPFYSPAAKGVRVFKALNSI